MKRKSFNPSFFHITPSKLSWPMKKDYVKFVMLNWTTTS